MKKKITITLYTSEILHDVENTAYLTGKAKRKDDNAESVALIQASEDSEDSDKIMRSIGSAYNTLFSIMSEYISDDTAVSDNVLWERDRDLVINLMMPSNFNLAETDSISSAATNYVANRALGDWFNIVSKDEAEGYYTVAAAALEGLKRSLSQRVRPQRLPVENGIPTYFGVVASDFTPSPMLVEQLKMSRLMSRAFKVSTGVMDNQKICYAYPKVWGMLNNILDDNMLEYLDSFSISVVRLAGEEYICYTLTEPVSVTNVELIFK